MGDLSVASFVDKFELLQPIPQHPNSDFAIDEAALVVSRKVGSSGMWVSADTDLCFKSNNFS
jgi:hypothetical protein